MRNTASPELLNPPPILPSSKQTLPNSGDILHSFSVPPPPKSTMYSPGSITVSDGKVKRLLTSVPWSDKCHPPIAIVFDPVFSISINSSLLLCRPPSLLASPLSPDGGSARTSLTTTSLSAPKTCILQSIPNITTIIQYLAILTSRDICFLVSSMTSANRVPKSGKCRKRH